MSETVVSLSDVVTRFGSNLVHDGLNLDIARGEIVALVGGSGSGKTTLLRHIIGLTQPAAGQVRLFGEPLDGGSIDDQVNRKRRFGVLFQQGALFSAFTVGENIAFPLRELGVATEDEIRQLVSLKLAMVEMEAQHAALMPAELSGGMVKRAALARALALEPELLLLDEPTAGLDPDRSASFVRLILSLHRELGLTVVLVTHDLDTLAAMSSKVAVLADRKILSYASLEETMLIEHPFIERFFRGEHGRRALARAKENI
ncbi:ATP-binding cassette domain-containing protein [Azoarcus communis]|uniref:ABC transporter ATP-binding protein n=1 Tax=Parazoarcus communis SWub3 = DSM 12120 TaxID=1121029 RepID=A0A323UPS5_9RHOO|nr:ATP-binding cassette domain-containing protein [Parazoarcus communis]NMG48541.1 ATP-binding cassette domain-containing protein [Parazoarcus communis]NMG71238.1 ATP-binding cassette domain-containing protein [Parazoarcus communis SWub3 = DSM 12120]PZA15002.1 ABC transporter ATP-binding protein [Azoarcus communis] [Parazoarcus communis SWub3 = DSM 12120]